MTTDIRDWLPNNIFGVFGGEGVGVIGAPNAGWFRYIGMSHANVQGWRTIIAYSFSNNETFIQTQTNGVWSGWTALTPPNPSFDWLAGGRQGLHVAITGNIIETIRVSNASGAVIATRTTTTSGVNVTITTVFNTATFAADGVTLTTRARTDTVTFNGTTLIQV